MDNNMVFLLSSIYRRIVQIIAKISVDYQLEKEETYQKWGHKHWREPDAPKN